MRHSLTALRFLLLSSFAFMPVFAQAPTATPAGSPAKTEESSLAAEPYVIESIQSKVRFEPDGKGERDLQLRIRVQSESAIREFGVLVYAYSASFENLDVLYARVRKPDGSIVETPASDIQELDSRSAVKLPCTPTSGKNTSL